MSKKDNDNRNCKGDSLTSNSQCPETEKQSQEESSRAYEAHKFWQETALNQLSTANNWLLGAATGFLAFCIANDKLSSIYFFWQKGIELKCSCAATMFGISLLFSVLSVFFGTIVLISRSADFRITRKITTIKNSFYVYGGETITTFKKTENPKWYSLFFKAICLLLFNRVIELTKDEILLLEKDEKGHKKDAVLKAFNKMRQDAHSLGIITWRCLKRQVGCLFLAVLFYVLYFIF